MVRTGKKEGNKFLPVNSSRFEAGNAGKKEGNKFLPVNSSRFEVGDTGKKGGSQFLPVNPGKYHAKLSRSIPVKSANRKSSAGKLPRENPSTDANEDFWDKEKASFHRQKIFQSMY